MSDQISHLWTEFIMPKWLITRNNSLPVWGETSLCQFLIVFVVHISWSSTYIEIRGTFYQLIQIPGAKMANSLCTWQIFLKKNNKIFIGVNLECKIFFNCDCWPNLCQWSNVRWPQMPHHVVLREGQTTGCGLGGINILRIHWYMYIIEKFVI